MTGTICPFCKRENPKIDGAKYCTFCSHILVERDIYKWKGEVLITSPNGDWDTLIADVCEHFLVETGTKDVIVDCVNNQLTPKRQQRLIRRYGLDGLPARTIAQIAQETGNNFTTVKFTLEGALADIRTALYRNGLATIILDSETQERVDKALAGP